MLVVEMSLISLLVEHIVKMEKESVICQWSIAQEMVTRSGISIGISYRAPYQSLDLTEADLYRHAILTVTGRHGGRPLHRLIRNAGTGLIPCL